MTIAVSPRGPVRANAKGLYRGHQADGEVRTDVLLPGQMPGRKFFRPAFTLRWGRRGRGKTLTLVAEGHHFREAYRARGLSNPKLKNGKENKWAWKVAANFQNSYADITHPFLVEKLTAYPSWAWNMRLEIDELAMYAHRRKWQLTSNLNLESFITQIRKRSIEPSAATQFPQRLDGDLVEQIDLFIDCDIEPLGCGNPEHTFCAAQRIHDWWGQWTGNTKRKPWPPNVWEYDYFKWFHNCKMFFGAYVTEEIHSPIWLRDSEKNAIRLKQWGDETSLQDDEVKYSQAQRAKNPTGVDIAYSREEMADWDIHQPDLSIGAPREDQLAAFLRDKAARQPGKVINLVMYVREAQNINPNIIGLKALSDFCAKQGWQVKRDRSSSEVYIP